MMSSTEEELGFGGCSSLVVKSNPAAQEGCEAQSPRVSNLIYRIYVSSHQPVSVIIPFLKRQCSPKRFA